MRYPKLRELREAVRALVKGPYTSKFPFQPHKPPERFRGKTEYHENECIGCTACVQVCPARALEFEDKVDSIKARRVLTVHWDLCIFCGQCQTNCPTQKGIMLSNEFDIATTGERQELEQKIEKELVLCDCCREVIACRDQILWVAKKIGPLVFSNASLMLLYLNNIGLILKEKFLPKQEELLRSDRIKLLCPRCRRETVIKS